MWFLVHGDSVVFNTWRGSIKGRHLLANPRAALTVDSEEFPYSFVTDPGSVLVDEAPADLVIWTTRIAERCVPSGRAEEYGRRNAGPEELVCRLRMERVAAGANIAL